MARRKLEPFLNVVGTGRAILNTKVCLGNTVDRVILKLGVGAGAGAAFTKAMIKTVRVKLNTKTVWEFTGDGVKSGAEQINVIRAYDGLDGSNVSFLVLDFTDINARTIQGEMLGGVDTVAQGVTEFVVEVDIEGATEPQLEAYAELSPPKQFSQGQAVRPEDVLFRAFLPTTISFSAAGEFTNDIGLGSRFGALIRRIHLFDPQGIVTKLQVLKDSVEVFQDQTKEVNDFLASDYGKTPQAGLFVYDPIINGNQSKAVKTLRMDGKPASFQWKITTSGSGVVFVMADLYSALPSV